MLVTQKMKMHLDRHDMNQRINAVQGDCYTRQVQISLFENGKAWITSIPMAFLPKSFASINVVPLPKN